MQTNQLVKPLLDWFLAEGWKPEVANSLRFALSDDDPEFKLSGTKIYGQIKDGDGNLLEVTVTNLSSLPTLPSHVIAASPKRPVHTPPLYVISLGFVWARDKYVSYDDLIYPRRLFVNGDKDKVLRLRPWIEDPDWTPQAHGLVDTGDTREGKRWALPRK